MHSDEVASVAHTGEKSDGHGTDPFERMCLSLYAYHFGTIGFLDLLATFEEILGIKPPQTDFQNAPDAKE